MGISRYEPKIEFLLCRESKIYALLFVVVSRQSQIYINSARHKAICVLKPSNVASKFGGPGVN